MKRIFFIAFLLIFSSSCNMEKKVIHFYKQKKVVINSITRSYQILLERYRITKATFRYTRDIDRIQCNLFINNSNKAIGLLVVPGSFVLEGFPNHSMDENEVFELLRKDNDFKTMLHDYMQSGAKALKLTGEGVFFAIGNPIYDKHPDYEGGLYVSYGTAAVKKKAKQIDANVYILDDRV